MSLALRLPWCEVSRSNPHYLGRNHETRTPPVIGAFDTETRVIEGSGPEVNVMRCWDLRGLIRNYGSYKDPVLAHTAGRTREELAAAVDRLCAGQERVWLYAHNLAFDLPVSALLDRLAARGWVMVRMALDGPSPWAVMGKNPHPQTRHRDNQPSRDYHASRGVTAAQCSKAKDESCPGHAVTTRYGCRLTIADSGSIWPRTKLADIGSDLGIAKLPDPPADDEPGWAERCAVDTQILIAAVSSALDWWEENEAGNWAKTGASTGWNSMRHRMTGKLPLIDTAHESVKLERRAISGGRRGTFRWGDFLRGRYSEADFERAYTVIARDLPMPVRRLGIRASLPVDHKWVTEDDPLIGLVAEVVISSGEGRWPCKDRGRVTYPKGRFTTVLAGPDVREAARLGALESIGRCQLYELGGYLRPWAEWNLTAQADPGTPPVVRRMLKHHGRAVIGKWGGHSYAHEKLGPSLSPGLHAEQMTVIETGVTGWVVDVAGERVFSYPDGEGEDSFPAVLAYVESHVRVRLSRMIAAVGSRVAMTCDTDGVTLDVSALTDAPMPGLPDAPTPGMPFRPGVVLDQLGTLCAPLSVKEKHHGADMRIIGPQHWSLGGMRKRSGIPANAEPQADGTLVGWTWPNLVSQAARGDPAGYVREPGSWTEPVCLASGWVLTSGRVVPPEACIDGNGENCLLPWRLTVYHRAGLQLGPAQNPALLAAVRDPGHRAQLYPWTNDQVRSIREEYS